MAIVNGYATLPEVKADLRLTTTNDDPRIERAIEAASRLIDNTVNRVFYTSTGTQVFGSWGVTVWVDDAQAVTLVEESTNQTTWTTTASNLYVTNPRPPIRQLVRTDGNPWAVFVRVTATWGIPAIPTDVKEACIIQAVRLFKRADSPEGFFASEFGAGRLGRVDPDVRNLLDGHIRRTVG
jgi:hypothetical protein